MYMVIHTIRYFCTTHPIISNRFLQPCDTDSLGAVPLCTLTNTDSRIVIEDEMRQSGGTGPWRRGSGSISVNYYGGEEDKCSRKS